MFYDNFSKVNDIRYKNIQVKNFDGIDTSKDGYVLGMNYSPLTYNFNYKKGVLLDSIGINKLKFKSYPDDNTFKELDDFPNEYHPTVCWHFMLWANDLKIYRSLFFVLGSDGYIYYNSLHTQITSFTKIEGLHFDDIPFVFSSKIDIDEVLIFVSKTNGAFVWTYPSIVTQINDMPIIDSVCVHNNRYFATVNNNKGSIIFSNDLNPINLNLDLMQGGEVVLNDGLGQCNKVVSFKGDLYIFRDFNILKLSEYSNKDDYSVTQIYASNGRIFENTICICGDNIIYLASDGIYRFDGNTAKIVDLKINSNFIGVDNYNAVAGYSEGDYYISCKLNYNDGNVIVDGEWTNSNNRNNALIKLNVQTDDIELFRGYDIVGVYIINDTYRNEICVRIREVGAFYLLGMLNNTGNYFDEPLTKVWTSPLTDFGESGKYKLIKEISFETKQNLTLKVIADKKIKEFVVKGKETPQTIKVNIKCKKFGFTFISKCVDNYITNPQIKVGYYD